MGASRHTLAAVALCLFGSAGVSGCAPLWPFAVIFPEQHTIQVRLPAELPLAPIPEVPEPPTVSDPQSEAAPQEISLDEAIRVALQNAEVVRVLAGVAAVSSGSTIYDPAITNTTIDQEQARFDPTLNLDNTWTRLESGRAIFDPLDPFGAVIAGTRTDGYNLDLGVTKTNPLGGSAGLGFDTNILRFGPGTSLLNPQTDSSLELSYVQPLLQGAGVDVNFAPIVLARIDTERSYFQLKDSVQELVRGVIEGYWALVFARTDLWARQQQVAQAEAALERSDARMRFGFADIEEVAQARLALANFRANLIAAEANLLQREAALRNILGLPPGVPGRLIPTTPPTAEEFDFHWDAVLNLAEANRPDIIELKLILEADEQQLLVASNAALPSLDAVGLYRWNGLEGRTPGGRQISSEFGEFADWTLGVNFSVPLGLRAARAAVRQRELLIARDRANLQQGLHSAAHQLGIVVRNVDQLYLQYEAFKETREAARINLDLQLAEFSRGRSIFLNVLQAISDWGNAVSAEAQALTQYNTALAGMERETGTILDTHGVRFFEERFESIGPLGRLHEERCYPLAMPPRANDERYPSLEVPAEQFFDLTDPLRESLPDVPEPPPALPAPRMPLIPPPPGLDEPLLPDFDAEPGLPGPAEKPFE